MVFPVIVSAMVRKKFGGLISSFRMFNSTASGNPLSNISSSIWTHKCLNMSDLFQSFESSIQGSWFSLKAHTIACFQCNLTITNFFTLNLCKITWHILKYNKHGKLKAQFLILKVMLKSVIFWYIYIVPHVIKGMWYLLSYDIKFCKTCTWKYSEVCRELALHHFPVLIS